MVEPRERYVVDERLLAATMTGLRDALGEARQTSDCQTTVVLPSTAIDGLLGMLRDPSTAEFWYRRRQFIVFYGRSRLILASA